MINWLTGLTLTVLVMPLLLRAAPVVGLLDHPDARKHHQGAIPLVGGLAMFIALSLSLPWLGHPYADAVPLLACVALMCVIGLADDWRGMSVPLRFLAEGTAALVMISLAGIHLDQLGNLFGKGTISLGVIAIPFTVFAVIGVTNAYNLVDGLDGLAGSLALVAVCFMAIAALHTGLTAQFQMLMLLAGAIVGFLLFNMRIFGRKRAAVFMGDSGSLMIGFVLAWFAVDLTQGEGRSLPPVVVLWFMAIPLWDTVSLMIRRTIQGKSPFHPGHDHLHHILQRAGYRDCQVVLIILTLAFAAALIGFVGWRLGVPQYLLFYAFMAVFFIYLVGVQHAWRLMKFLKQANAKS
jgi:UDP-GlcNAc:undecaprenyl-phosphate/decaprenyl-phosphate GlcNAc-1-phosphate transferase